MDGPTSPQTTSDRMRPLCRPRTTLTRQSGVTNSTFFLSYAFFSFFFLFLSIFSFFLLFTFFLFFVHFSFFPFSYFPFFIGRTHFHPKTISSNDTFIQNTSSNFDTFIQTQFHPMNTHPKTVSSKKFACGTINKVRISVKASPAEGR